MEKSRISSLLKNTLEWNYFPHAIFLVKVVAMVIFSSDFQDKLFIPFVSLFLDHGHNPWQMAWQSGSALEFPYHPVMLYLLSIVYAPVHYLMGDQPLMANLFFKLPVLCSDLLIYALLLKIFGDRKKEILVFYLASPIIFYASYLHSQLDLIPTAVLFLSIHQLVRNNIWKSALLFGLAASIKLHVIAAAPLMVIYLLRKKNVNAILSFSALSLATYGFWLAPFYSEGFVHLVLNNSKQKSLVQSAVEVANVKIFLPLLAACIIYFRFFLYKKINNDLLFTFLAILFSLFVILIPPSPAWYIWLFPFLSIFFIKNYRSNTTISYLYAFLNLCYLLFFLFSFIPDYADLKVLGNPIDLKIADTSVYSVLFTTLVGSLLACIYAFYNFGVRSNSIYKKDQSTIIGIGGDSGSGKTTLLSDLKKVLGNNLTEIEGDGDHKWERNNENWKQVTHLNPKANFLHKQSEDLLALKSGKEIYRSDYDHNTGAFTSPKKIIPKEFISISGLHPFYLPIMRKIIDLKIFVDTDEKLRLHWKVVRDIKKRGYTKEEILKQLEKRESDSAKYISPQKNFADLVITYFTEENFEIGSEALNISIKLKLTLNADISLDNLVNQLYECQVPISWDYSEDLRNQILILHEPLRADLNHSIAKSVIPNLDELTQQQVEWEEGYRGFVQMIVLYSLSERLKSVLTE
jgi:uridine kinase